jgi:Ca2+/Na+ antiporter
MRKSTFRIVKSIGMFLFLILFGVFVYAMTRTENTERTDLAYSPEAEPQDSKTSGPAGIRTQDPYIKSVLLYQLSYETLFPIF